MKKKINKPTTQEWLSWTQEQKLDWVMANDLMDEVYFQKNFTNQDCKSYIKRKVGEMVLKTSTKCNCPTCGKSQGYEKQNLAAGVLEFAIVLAQKSEKLLEEFNLNNKTNYTVKDLAEKNLMPSVHYDEILDHIKKTTKGKNGKGRNPTNYATLKLWGLIVEDIESFNHLIKGKGEYDGMFIPPKILFEFIHGNIKLPKKVYSLNGEFHHAGDKMVYFNQCGIMNYVQRQNYRTTYYQ